MRSAATFRRDHSPFIVAVCLLLLSCGGGDPSGPTTTHDLAGAWSYDMPDLQDGHGLHCAILGPTITFTQSGGAVTFGGHVSGGTETCTYLGTPVASGAMSSADILDGAISQDTVTFDVMSAAWHNVGRFVTADSMTGLVNSFVVYQGQQYYLVGNWYSKRQ